MISSNRRIIKELHRILKKGTKDAGPHRMAFEHWFAVHMGLDYKKRANMVGGCHGLPLGITKTSEYGRRP